ncbi:MAG: RNA-directed DNA polymerase [bacterium]
MSDLFTFEKLYRAYLDCRRTKRKTINALKFEWNLERNLFQLQKELKDRKYKPGRSVCFVISKPSPREIFAASFRDRVIHHFLIREIEKAGEKNLIFDTFSCRKNKGTHLAIKRLKKFIRQITKNSRGNAFYAQLDVSGFFMSIDRHILYSIFEKLILKQRKFPQWEKDVLWLAKTIIFHKPTENYVIKGDPSLFKLIPPKKSLFKSPRGRGLPIGNYSSQFFANLYLNELDQFIKRKLKCQYYLRYVDDLVLLDKSREKFKIFRNKINLYLKRSLNLELNLQKTKIRSARQGIDFLGYFLKPEYVLIRKKVVSRMKDKLHKLNNNPGKIPELKKVLATINSYYGHFKHAFSFNLKKDIYENHLGNLQNNFLPKPDYSSLKINYEVR